MILASRCVDRGNPCRACESWPRSIVISSLRQYADFDDEHHGNVSSKARSVPADEIRAAIRKATIAVKMVPVTCGTSYKNKGVQKLLDAIVDYMPSPLDVPAIEGVNPKTDEEETREADDNAPFSALAFKIMSDPFVGKIELFPCLLRLCEDR